MPVKALQHLVVTSLVAHRPCFAIAGERAINQARIHFFQTFVIDAETHWYRGPEVVNQNIRRSHQAHECGNPFFLLKIESEPTLTAVRTEKCARFRFQSGRIIPQRISVMRLDLDHIGAQIRQQ